MLFLDLLMAQITKTTLLVQASFHTSSLTPSPHASDLLDPVPQEWGYTTAAYLGEPSLPVDQLLEKLHAFMAAYQRAQKV